MKAMAALIAASVVVSGCATQITEDRYNEVQVKLRTDAAFRNTELAGCRKVMARIPRVEQEAYELMFNVPRNRLGERICSRLVSGLRSGRLSYADVNDFLAGRDYKAIILVMMGKK